MKYLYLLLLLLPVCAKGQPPGGVPGCEAWLVTTPVGSDLNGSYRWADLSGDSARVLTAVGVEYTRPRDSVQTFNFHPALRLSSASGQLSARLREALPGQCTVIGVFAPSLSSVNSDMTLYTSAGADTTAVSRTQVIHSGGGSLTYDGHWLTDSARSPRVITWERAASPPVHSVWGSASGVILSPGGASPLLPGTPPVFDGWCPELLAYGRVLSPLERRQAESYLALKYGLTLDGSYWLGDRLVWDVGGSDTLRRVAGIVYGGPSGLRQPFSTTSYADSTFFSVLPAYDSFYARDSYGKASPYRLLAMGRHPGTYIPDGSYMLWGDDDGRADIAVDAGSGWHAMPRRWVVSTDLDTLSAQPLSITCGNAAATANGSLLNLKGGTSGDGWVRIGPQTPALHLAFTCPADGKAFDVGIVFNESDEVVYGYRFKASGAVHRIIDGAARPLSIISNARGHDIEIYRRGDDLCLRMDGRGNNAYTVPVRVQTELLHPEPVTPRDGGDGDDRTIVSWPLPVTGYSSYGLVRLSAGCSLRNLRAHGFRDTGACAELSYDIASEFKDHRLSRAFLLLNGADGETRRQRCAGFDPVTHKILFDGFRPADGDTLSFAWYGGLLATATAAGSSCLGGTPFNDGSVTVSVECGTPPIEAVLTPEGSTAPAASGMLLHPDSTRLTLGGLAPGAYTLQVTQSGSATIYGRTPEMNYVRMFRDTGDCDLSWTVSDTLSLYCAGFSKKSTTVYDGFYVDHGTLKQCRKGSVVSSTAMPVFPGTVLHIRRTGSRLQLAVNDTVVRDSLLSFPANYDRDYSRFLCKIYAGESYLCGLRGANPSASPALSSDRVFLEASVPDTLRYAVVIGGCDGTPTSVTPLDTPRAPRLPAAYSTPDNDEQADSLLTAAPAPTPCGLTVTLSPRLWDEGAVEVLVCDTAGRLCGRAAPHRGETTLTLTMRAPGVYLVKALTPFSEHTVKTACK